MKWVLSWDFFGADGAGTAAHFARHLIQFLSAHALGYEPTTSAESGRASVHLQVNEADVERLRLALRPRRIEPAEAEPPQSGGL
jgi:hypothetical protein